MGFWQALKESWISYNKYSMMEMMAYLPENYWQEENQNEGAEMDEETEGDR